MKVSLWPLMLALAMLAGCASVGTDRTQQQRLAEVNTQLGVQYLRQGELEQAAQRLSRAVRQDPQNAEAPAAFALLNEQLNEEGTGRRHYQRALQLAPEDSSILNNYGRFLCEHGEVEEAERLFKLAAENPLYRGRELPLTNAGLCLLRAGERERGEQYLLQALQVNPRFAPALLPMAEIRHQSGHHLSARGFYQRYLEVAPQTARTLLLGIGIEQALGNRDAVASYSLSLRSRFPDSEEARKLLEIERDGR